MPSTPTTAELIVAGSRGLNAPRVGLLRSTAESSRVDSDLEGQLTAALPNATLLSYRASDGLPQLSARLAAAGRFDVLADLTNDARTHIRLPALIGHLKTGGRLLVRRTKKGAVQLDELLDHLRDSPGKSDIDLAELTPQQRDLAEVARGVESVSVVGDLVVVTSSVEVYSKLSEKQVRTYLAANPDAGTVLWTQDKAPWTSKALITGSDPAASSSSPSEFEGDELSVRSFHGPTCLPRSAVLHRNVALPESFRRQQQFRMSNAALVPFGRHFVQAPPTPTLSLDGRYFHVDNEWRGQFGHALIEQLSRLWAWPRVASKMPGIRVLVSEYPGAPVSDWEYTLLAAAGVSPEQVVVIDEPVIVEQLITATPGYSLPDQLHPIMERVYRSVGDALEAQSEPGFRPRRIFLSRRPGGRRSCRNSDEVEALMLEHGFEIVFPEDHPLPEQVALVRSADVIAGFRGSGMYQVALTNGPKHLIALGSDTYTASVEQCLAALLGHRLDLVNCRSEVPIDSRGSRAFHADYSFNPAREGLFLRSVLSELT